MTTEERQQEYISALVMIIAGLVAILFALIAWWVINLYHPIPFGGYVGVFILPASIIGKAIWKIGHLPKP